MTFSGQTEANAYIGGAVSESDNVSSCIACQELLWYGVIVWLSLTKYHAPYCHLKFIAY